MPRSQTQHSRISAIHTTVGPELRRIDDESEQLGLNPQQMERLKRTIGLNERRVAPRGITAADLCYEAAQQLPELSGVDGLIFVTQSPDHFQPCNAALLHGRLSLSNDCAAFDINLGCSGWVYGLYMASLMVETGGCRKVLLLAGDTLSQCVNPRDRAVASLFGDAGSATLVERTETPVPAWFALHTAGKDAAAIQVPAGAFRLPKSPETAIATTDADGNTRTPENLQMNGAEVFNFSIREEPPAIAEILDFAKRDIDSIDAVVFHQANKYIISNIARRVKLPLEKAPSNTVEKYGNQSSASIPATICDTLGDTLTREGRELIFSGFGVGLSWASALTRVGKLSHCQLSVFGGE